MAGLCHPGQLSTTMPTRANVPWRRNGCAWARRTLNSRQSAETTPTATPRCPRCCRRFSGARAGLALSRLPRALPPGAPHRASLALRHLLSDQAALRLQGPQHAFAPELGGGDPVRSGRSWPVRRRPSWPTRSCSGSGAASWIAVAGMPAPPTAPATSADHRHDPCQASSQSCPNERADYLFGPGTGGLVGDQPAAHIGGSVRPTQVKGRSRSVKSLRRASGPDTGPARALRSAQARERWEGPPSAQTPRVKLEVVLEHAGTPCCPSRG